MKSDFFYLDYNATTNLHPDVLLAMKNALEDSFANASSPHQLGREALIQVDKARQQVADLVGSEPRKVRFTSGATESNNWVIYALRQMHHHPQAKILVSEVEHPSVYELGDLFVPILSDGRVDLGALEEMIQKHHQEIALVSIMSANNETGIIQPIEDIYQICKRENVLFHTDATQIFGKISMEITADFITLSAHKFGGPKGIGALILNTEIPSMIKGGTQERESRAGTTNVPSVIGFGMAAQIARQNRISNKLQREIEHICRRLGGQIIGDSSPRLPNTTCAIFEGIPGDMIVASLDLQKIYISTGSACSSGSHKTSHVLAAMGYTGAPIRISYGPEYNDIPPSFLTNFEDVLKNTIAHSVEDDDLDDWSL
jgi:cysteine desulfurase